MGALDPQQAWERLGQCLHLTGMELVPAREGLGRVLAEEVLCSRDLPAEDRALKDGYALGRLGDQVSEIPVLGESAAGDPWKAELPEGRAVRVRTGAVVPRGTLAVVPVEEVEESPDGSWVRLRGAPPPPGSHVGHKGHLAEAGSALLGPGTRLGPGELSLLVAAGVSTVRVRKRPLVYLLPTGSELAQPEWGLGFGQSFVSHAWYLAWRVAEEGGLGEVLSPVPDLREKLWAAMEEATERADLVVTTGGTGPSDRDLVFQTLLSRGAEVLFNHLPMRPGATISALLVGSTPVIALPGGAGGIGLGCELLLAPAVRALQGESSPEPRWVECRLAREMPRDPSCHRFVETTIQARRGELLAYPVPRGVPGAGLVPLRGKGWIHVPPGSGSLPRGGFAGLLLGRCRGGPSTALSEQAAGALA